MSKLVVTRYKGRILTAFLRDGRCCSLNLEPEEQEALLGNIYIGKVKNVVKNINAAFVDLGEGRTGFYSLAENREHLYADRLQTDGGRASGSTDMSGSASVSGSAGMSGSVDMSSVGNPSRQASPVSQRALRAGDEIVVQVARDAVKTKDPVLSSNLNFTGKYAVLTLGKTQIGFSAKIGDPVWKETVREYLSEFKDDRYGIIVRTNAREVQKETVGEEVLLLKERMETLFAKAANRTCFSLLDGAEPYYILSLRDTYADRLESIVTDDPACYERMRHYLAENQKRDLEKLKLYSDELLPLVKLYSLESAMEEASGRRVWLKSGGYLVIEPTEALTVIDVNTGKYSGKKNAAETILKINLEAAVETARQLSLRNLSGIIVVDFIDMAAQEHKKLLLTRLEEELARDPVKTVLVEMTKLGLVELTRKKVRKPFHEMLHS